MSLNPRRVITDKGLALLGRSNGLDLSLDPFFTQDLIRWFAV